MKELKPIIIWTTVIFIVFTLLTMKNEVDANGFNSYGFPFTFYTYFSGKCVNCQENLGFKPAIFLIVIMLAITIAFVTMQKKLGNNSKPRNEIISYLQLVIELNVK